MDAEEILAAMQAAGVQPPAAAFNALLSCYARAARAGAMVRAADAVEVVRRMEAAGLRAGEATYGAWMALIRDAAARSLATRHDAAHVVTRMRDSGFAPKVAPPAWVTRPTGHAPWITWVTRPWSLGHAPLGTRPWSRALGHAPLVTRPWSRAGFRALCRMSSRRHKADRHSARDQQQRIVLFD